MVAVGDDHARRPGTPSRARRRCARCPRTPCAAASTSTPGTPRRARRDRTRCTSAPHPAARRGAARRSAGTGPGDGTSRTPGPGRTPGARPARARARRREPRGRRRTPTTGTRAPRDSPSRFALSTTRGLSRRAAGRSRTQPTATSRSTSVVRVCPAKTRAPPSQLLPKQCGVAGMHAGTERFGEQRVAVVPQRDQPEVGDRRVHRRAIADDHARRVREGAQERGIPRRTALLGVVADEGVGGDAAQQSRLELRAVAMVGNGDDGAAPGGEHVGRRGGEQHGPRSDDGAVGQLRRHRRRVQREALAAVERLGEARIDGQHLGGPGGIRILDVRTRGRLGGQPRLLRADHALGDRQPQDVARRPRRAIGRAARQRVQCGRQHRHRRDDRLELRERAVRGIRLPQLDEEAVHDASGAAQRHAHAHAGLRVGGELRGDLVVEQPVQLRQRRVEEHARDAARRSRAPGGAVLVVGHRGHAAGVRARRPRAGRRRGPCAPR